MIRAALSIIALVSLAAPALASSPAEWAKQAAEAKAACLTASELDRARIESAQLGFSDTIGVDAMLVTGQWRQKHMHKAQATVLCLYDRAKRHAETTEAVGWTAR